MFWRRRFIGLVDGEMEEVCPSGKLCIWEVFVDDDDCII
jgi:hypothetical protein